MVSSVFEYRWLLDKNKHWEKLWGKKWLGISTSSFRREASVKAEKGRGVPRALSDP